MRTLGLAALLALSACSRSGLLSADLDVGNGSGGAGVSSDAGTGEDGGAPPTEPTRRWAAVTTEDGAGSQQLFAVRFGAERVEHVVRLDPEAEHAIRSATWAPGATAVAFIVEEAIGELSGYLADFRSGPPVVTPIEVSAELLWFGPWLDGTHVLVSTLSDGAERVTVHDLDGATASADPEPSGVAHFYSSLSPDRRLLVVAYESRTGGLHSSLATVTNGVLGAYYPLHDFVGGFSPGPDAWAADWNAYAWIAYDHTQVDPLGFPRAEIVAFDLSSTIPVRAPAFRFDERTDHPNFLEFARGAPRYLVHSTRIVDLRGFVAIGIQDTASGLAGEAQPERFFGTVDGFSAGGRGVVYSGFDDEFGPQGASFIDVTDPSAPGATQFLEDEEGKPVRGAWVLKDGSALLAVTGALSLDFTSQMGPVDWVRFDLTPTLGPADRITRLSEVATVDAWQESPDETALIYRTSIGTLAIPDTDPLLYRRAAEELGVYWATRDGSNGRTPLATKWTAYDVMQWLPDSRSVLRFAPVSDPSVVADTHDQNGQGVSLYRDGAYLLEWVQLTAPKVVALTPKFGAGRSVVPFRVALPDRWDD